jgi:Ser/Thr protein kinase RdoA (MazF antagonist)
VKTLPDNPSLDHLRRQARDLLAGMRDAQPEASLADAQRSLAQQYGFRTWTDLKAEVDRVRGRADFAADAVAQAIAARFALGQVSGPMRSLARADEIGRPWSLETEHGRWAVRQLDECFDVDNAHTDVRLQAAAAETGVLLPAPVRSTSGAVVESIDGQNWRVHAWMDSGPPMSAPVSASIAGEVGVILATLHGLALPAPDGIGWWHLHRPTDAEWYALAARAQAIAAGWAPSLTVAIPGILELTRSTGTAEPPPAILCHASLGPGNVRLTPGGRLAVLGWEHAGALPTSWELGGALMSWTIGQGSEGVSLAAGQALLDGYGSVAGALPALDLTMFSSAIAGWLNYVFGQISAALAASRADDQRHLHRSVRHLLSHAPARADLQRLLEGALVPS